MRKKNCVVFGENYFIDAQIVQKFRDIQRTCSDRCQFFFFDERQGNFGRIIWFDAKIFVQRTIEIFIDVDSTLEHRNFGNTSSNLTHHHAYAVCIKCLRISCLNYETLGRFRSAKWFLKILQSCNSVLDCIRFTRLQQG